MTLHSIAIVFSSATDEMPCAGYSGIGLRVERAACNTNVDPWVKGVLQSTSFYVAAAVRWTLMPRYSILQVCPSSATYDMPHLPQERRYYQVAMDISLLTRKHSPRLSEPSSNFFSSPHN